RPPDTLRRASASLSQRLPHQRARAPDRGVQDRWACGREEARDREALCANATPRHGRACRPRREPPRAELGLPSLFAKRIEQAVAVLEIETVRGMRRPRQPVLAIKQALNPS